MAIASGTTGPGGAKWGMGAGGPNRYDYTQLGAGLWSVGIDINAPDARQQVDAWMARLSAAERADVMKAVNRPQPGRGSMDAYIYGADARQRDVARQIQKTNGFFDSTLGKVFSAVAPIAGGFFLGPLAGAAIGATTGGIKNGPLGAILGGLGGYGGGTLGSSLATNGVGGTISNAINGIKGFFGGPALNNVNTLLPAAYASRAVTGAGSLAGTLGNTALTSGSGLLSNLLGGGGSSAGAAGGGGMGFFSDLLTGMAPNLLGGAISYLGQKSAQEDFNKIAQQLAQQSQFSPYNITGPGGSVAFNGNNVTASLSPELQAQLGQMDKVTRGAFEDYLKFNAGGYANNYYSTIKNMQEPTDQAMTNDLLDRVYASGNWGSTTGAQDIYSYQQSKAIEDQMLRLQAQQAGAQEQDRLFDRYFKSSASQQALAQSPYDLVSLGANVGAQRSGAAAQAAQYPWLSAGNSANASSAFWSFLGGSASNAVGSILQKYGNYEKEANRPVFTPSPYFSGGNNTMTWRP